MNNVKTITSKKGKKVVFRYPEETDAAAMCDYINTLSKERTFIRMQGEQMTLDEEQKFLEGKLKAVAEKTSVFLLATVHDQLIGISQIDLGKLTDKHIGTFGISLHKDFREEGIGRALMTTVIEEAQKHLSGLEVITLGIHAQNTRAMNLYTSLGFIEYGRLPKGIKLASSYDDHIWMYKKV